MGRLGWKYVEEVVNGLVDVGAGRLRVADAAELGELLAFGLFVGCVVQGRVALRGLSYKT